jgi:hypothetical protein
VYLGRQQRCQLSVRKVFVLKEAFDAGDGARDLEPVVVHNLRKGRARR